MLFDILQQVGNALHNALVTRVKGREALGKAESAPAIVKSMTLINKSKALNDNSKPMIWIFSRLFVPLHK